MKKLKYGVVGCGGIAIGKHLPALKKLNDKIEIVAFCDIIIEKANKVNAEYANNQAKVMTDYKELVKLDLDVVLVLTPNGSHCEISVAALNAKKHVLCEKPMATTHLEATKMCQAAKQNGKILSVGYQNRYRADSLYLKEQCNAGAFGEIYYAQATALRRRGVPTWGVFLDKEKQGGGPLIDIGTHALDLTLWLMDNYKPKYAVGTTYYKLNNDKNTGNIWGDWDTSKFTAEDSAFGFVVMQNGATIIVRSSWALNITEVREACTTLCGTNGGADMLLEGKLQLNGVSCSKQYTMTPDLSSGGVAFFDGQSASLKPEDIEANIFYNAVKGLGELTVTAEQSAVVTMILEGIYKSALSGKPHYFD